MARYIGFGSPRDYIEFHFLAEGRLEVRLAGEGKVVCCKLEPHEVRCLAQDIWEHSTERTEAQS